MRTLNRYALAYLKHSAAAETALALFRSMCEQPMPRVPGVDTVIRLAWRIECGRSPEDAAVKEYLYRWNLALKSWRSFGSPDILGA